MSLSALLSDSFFVRFFIFILIQTVERRVVSRRSRFHPNVAQIFTEFLRN